MPRFCALTAAVSGVLEQRAMQRAPELRIFRADFGADFETLFAATLAALCANP
jgi:hypothetical protein